ncbi:MAG: UDP-3-O-acyl-N-acetylglucosamine deacetylase [Neisseriaceae bacterium]|nr:MAG: UDP-3-O-acyl-N-acetylglucosamine deacetylase [Neisseriaceae bacterium]
MLQRTLKKEVTITGVGLHSGERVRLSLIPADIDKGIMFRRVDLPEDQNRIINLNPYLINDTRLSSTIVTSDGIRIGTIEHLMSAFCALGIDNVLVELNAPEIPIMDGSSLSFIHVITEAGIVEQKKEKVFLKIKKLISVDEIERKVEIIPHDGFIVSLTIKFDHPVFNRSNQTFDIDFVNASYIDEIARARTFGFMQEIELMRTHNLGLGGNLNNAIVIDDEGILNPEGLRYPDEFVRHKVLDAIGDLYVIGYQIIGHFKGYKSGHAINNSLLRKILESDDNYDLVTFPNDEKLPSAFHYL